MLYPAPIQLGQNGNGLAHGRGCAHNVAHLPGTPGRFMTALTRYALTAGLVLAMAEPRRGSAQPSPCGGAGGGGGGQQRTPPRPRREDPSRHRGKATGNHPARDMPVRAPLRCRAAWRRRHRAPGLRLATPSHGPTTATPSHGPTATTTVAARFGEGHYPHGGALRTRALGRHGARLLASVVTLLLRSTRTTASASGSYLGYPVPYPHFTVSALSRAAPGLRMVPRIRRIRHPRRIRHTEPVSAATAVSAAPSAAVSGQPVTEPALRVSTQQGPQAAEHCRRHLPA